MSKNSSPYYEDARTLTPEDRSVLADLVKTRLWQLETRRVRAGYWENTSNESEFQALRDILDKLGEP